MQHGHPVRDRLSILVTTDWRLLATDAGLVGSRGVKKRSA